MPLFYWSLAGSSAQLVLFWARRHIAPYLKILLLFIGITYTVVFIVLIVGYFLGFFAFFHLFTFLSFPLWTLLSGIFIAVGSYNV